MAESKWDIEKLLQRGNYLFIFYKDGQVRGSIKTEDEKEVKALDKVVELLKNG